LHLALQSGDELNAARVRTRALAWVARHRGDLDEAAQHIEWALPVFRRFGQETEFFYARRNQGRIAYERRNFGLAEQVLGEALAYFQSVDDRRHIYLTTANLAEVALARGGLDRAWTLCYSVLVAARKYNDPERAGSLLKVLGEVARRRGDLGQARALWNEGLQYMQHADRLDEIADAQLRLAQVELAIDEKQVAYQRLLNALDAYRRLDMPEEIKKVEALLADQEPSIS
jgi:tetratricopeptide (TPR) repeat protein